VNILQTETKIISRLIDDAIHKKLSISVDDGHSFCLQHSQDRNKILAALRTTSSDTLYFYNANGDTIGWVQLHYNTNCGCDVIADYSNEDIVRGADELALQLEDAA
jgi:hypothetical protein